MSVQPSLFPVAPARPLRRLDPLELSRDIQRFDQFGASTAEGRTTVEAGPHGPLAVPTYTNAFWTSRQRAAHTLHEISYRACFKAQLPRFFIERLTSEDQVVYDPFMGRGTTPLEAALLGRRPLGCDVSPLAAVMVSPRLAPPTAADVGTRLNSLALTDRDEFPEDLLAFYHPDTLREICALKKYLLGRRAGGDLDPIDAWIEMVALNRLTGHSPGFFSVYTMPPNQAVSVQSQQKINRARDQVPPRRDVRGIIAAKTRSLLAACDPAAMARLQKAGRTALFLTADADQTPQIADRSVHLAVTSPPFLDVVDYASDNWLRCWFIGIEADKVPISVFRRLDDWQAKMTRVLTEVRRTLVEGGYVAFEVGEVKGAKVKLEEAALLAGVAAGLTPVFVLINSQPFTKTANCWGITNNAKGTNTNRVVLLRSS